MLATVTNTSPTPRGFSTLDHGIVVVEAGASALLDLADHLLHRAWVAAGHVLIAPLTDRDAKAARKQRDGEAATAALDRDAALAALPPAAPATPTA